MTDAPVTKILRFFPEIGGSTVSAVATITSRQSEFEWWFRQLGTAVAILAGALTIVSLLRKWRQPVAGRPTPNA